MTFSRSTLDLFANLLDQVQLSARDPKLAESAAVVVRARDELAEAIKELPIVLPLAAEDAATP